MPADRACDSLRRTLTERHTWVKVKPMRYRKKSPALSQFLCRYRNVAERFFSKIKHFRAGAARFESTTPVGKFDRPPHPHHFVIRFCGDLREVGYAGSSGFLNIDKRQVRLIHPRS